MICDGLDIGYFSNIWIYHGELDYTQARLKNEQPVQVDDMHGMLGNAFGVLDDGGSEFDGVDLSGGGDDNNGGSDENIDDGNKENLNDYTETFYNLLKDVEQELYLGYSEVWKNFDIRYPDFASDPYNVRLGLASNGFNPYNFRLGLASNGFNPFGTMSIFHSTWPVVLMIYNLPTWICMKQLDFIMSLLISGPSALGNDIDVYLQPLIEELKELCDNVDVIELDYYGGRKLALFKCDWIDINSNRGTKKDELGFTPVNPSCLLKTKELFILASQEIQIFYIKDPMETDWHDVVFTKPRDLNDMDEFANVGDLLMENESDNTTNLQQFMDNKDDVRDNVLEIMLNSPVNIVDVGAENNDSDDEDEDEYDN
ncbi:hypothetical protein LWI28_027600 [Acer negundo]|uniref:DUF4216 domain-containing protein n=1 Tax=Acer negundo TaxID=4023 RepID=A0AAD5JKG9_ACENE|nr:hypothetical protein LWI28_027600 [Acer negundo]